MTQPNPLVPSQEAREAAGDLRLVILKTRSVRVSIKAGRAVNDPEKMVLPGIIYATKSDTLASAYCVAIGWWDWHISLLIGRNREPGQ